MKDLLWYLVGCLGLFVVIGVTVAGCRAAEWAGRFEHRLSALETDESEPTSGS